MTEIIKKKRGRPAKDKEIVKTAERIIEKSESLSQEIEKAAPIAHAPTIQSIKETSFIVGAAVNALYVNNRQEYEIKKTNFLTSVAMMPQEEASLHGWFRYIELESTKNILATILANPQARKVLIESGIFTSAA